MDHTIQERRANSNGHPSSTSTEIAMNARCTMLHPRFDEGKTFWSRAQCRVVLVMASCEDRGDFIRQGEISFEFVRVAPHVHLSGVAIGRVREARISKARSDLMI